MSGETLERLKEQNRKSRKYLTMMYKGIPIGKSIVVFTVSDLQEVLVLFKEEVIEMNERQRAMDKLYEHKNVLTYQQYRTFKGQICSGDITGFYKGLKKVLKGRNR